MAVAPVGTSSLQGIQGGLAGVRRAAAQIARPRTVAAPADYARALVQMQQGATQARASVKAFNAGQENLGTLLDIRA